MRSQFCLICLYGSRYIYDDCTLKNMGVLLVHAMSRTCTAFASDAVVTCAPPTEVGAAMYQLVLVTSIYQPWFPLVVLVLVLVLVLVKQVRSCLKSLCEDVFVTFGPTTFTKAVRIFD
jgi:hypothetical protein